MEFGTVKQAVRSALNVAAGQGVDANNCVDYCESACRSSYEPECFEMCMLSCSVSGPPKPHTPSHARTLESYIGR